MVRASPLLSFENIAKAFGGVYALRDVTFSVDAGECVSLVGENGAGKSTLMKILSGVWPHGTYAGEVRWMGQPLRLKGPLEARATGISIIHQELSLFSKLTVAENFFLTDQFPYDGTPSSRLMAKVRWQEMEREARYLFDELGLPLVPQAVVEDLSVAGRQLVEIARAFHQRAKLLILDEPTSALTDREVRYLFDVIRRFRQRGMTFLYISHKFDEIFALSDRIVVLRDGRAVANLSPAETTEKEVVSHMVGRPLRESTGARALPTGNVVLDVRDLAHVEESGKQRLSGVTFNVRAGEIVGIAGLMGSGRSELLRSLVGVLPGTRTGTIFCEGKEVEWLGITDAIEDGVAFVPEDRKKDGLFLEQSVSFNISISILQRLLSRLRRLDLSREQGEVTQWIERMGVKCHCPSTPVRLLSGGNQQKVLLSRVVALRPKLLLLDEPTRGIDVGAKEEIYGILRRLAAEGVAILLVSSELPEILYLCHRVIVLRQGTTVGEFPNVNLTQEMVMSYAAGSGKENHASL